MSNIGEFEEEFFIKIILLIPFQAFLKFFKSFSKNLVKYFCLLFFIKVENMFLYLLYLIWSSIFWVRSFLLMKSLNNLFLIETDFFSAVVNQGLVLNLSLYLLSFFNGECLSRILLMESKMFWKDVLVLLSWSFRIWGKSIAK